MPSIRQKSKPARTTPFLLVLLVALAAAVAVPAVGQAEPAEEPQPQLAFEPGSYDFGMQQVESGGGQANLQLRNVGEGEVHVDTLGIVGSGSEAFWFGYDNCAGQTLQPGQTCSVGVSFNPHSATGYSAQVVAKAGGQHFTADLSGSGGRAEVGVASNPTYFGVAAVGSAGVTREIAVTNSGNLPAGFFIAVISGGAVGSYQLLDENCTGHLLAPAATCIVQIRFRPLSEGVKTAYMSLFGDQGGGAQIVLSGVGAAPDSPSLAGGAEPTSTSAGQAARRKFHKRRSRLRGRHRRAALDAGRVLTRAG